LAGLLGLQSRLGYEAQPLLLIMHARFVNMQRDDNWGGMLGDSSEREIASSARIATLLTQIYTKGYYKH
jgi:hypothetical protein